MSRTRTAVERMARQPVPTDDQVRRAVLSSEPDRLLHGITNDVRLRAVPGRGPGHRRWRPVLVVGVAVTAVLAAVAVFVLPAAVGDRPLPGVAGPGPAPSVTTAPDAATVLRQLADRAAAQPPVPDKRFDYLRTESWYPRPVADADGTWVGTSGEQRTESESWVDAGGTGRWMNLSAGDDDATVTDVVDLPPPIDLPTEPAALEAVLRAQPPDNLTATALYDAMAGVWLNQVVEPQAQAAFLRLLATKEGVRALGPVTDRLGRQGIAVTMSETGQLWAITQGLPDEARQITYGYTLILDPRTGAVLALEQVLVEGGDHPGPRPTLLSHTEWVRTGRVDSVEERP